MMKNKILFQKITNIDSGVLIGGKNSKASADDQYFNTGIVRLKKDSVLILPFTELKMFIGNLQPRKHLFYVSASIVSENKLFYVGSVKKSEYMLLENDTQVMNFDIYVDSRKKISSIYLMFNRLPRVLKALTVEKPENLQSDINELGKKHGCHICGKKNRAMVPHLLPPSELSTVEEQRWYPICTRDYKRYEKELQQIIKNNVI